MDADIFVSGKKKLRIKKYPDTCGRGLRVVVRVIYGTAVFGLLNIVSSLLCIVNYSDLKIVVIINKEFIHGENHANEVTECATR